MCAVRGWCVPIIIHVHKRTFSIIQSSICVLFTRTPFSCTIKNNIQILRGTVVLEIGKHKILRLANFKGYKNILFSKNANF